MAAYKKLVGGLIYLYICVVANGYFREMWVQLESFAWQSHYTLFPVTAVVNMDAQRIRATTTDYYNYYY